MRASSGYRSGSRSRSRSLHGRYNGRYNGSAVVSNRNLVFLDIITAADKDATYGTYVDDECFDIHDYDDDTDHDTDDTDDDTDGDTDTDDAIDGKYFKPSQVKSY